MQVWKQLKLNVQKEYEQLEDKVKYLNKLTNEKKELTKKIEQIDKLLKNKELLQSEYEQRNAKLANKDKIFSARQLNNLLEIERQEYINKIKECNNLIDPKGYVARKTEIEKQYKFLKTLEFEEQTNNSFYQFCEIFLECFKIKILKATTKQEIVKYIYELRYYGFLSVDNSMCLKNVKTIENKFEQTIKTLYNKARELNVIEDVTKDEKANYKIVHQIFECKMIDLNNMVIETKVENGQLFIEYYDANILETRIQLYSEKTIKLNKKTKLFS